MSEERIGERVCVFKAQTGQAFGSADEFVLVPSSHAPPLPENASFDVWASRPSPPIAASSQMVICAESAFSSKAAREPSARRPSSSPNGREDPTVRLSMPFLSTMFGGYAFRFIFFYTIPEDAFRQAEEDSACGAAGAYWTQIAMKLPLDRLPKRMRHRRGARQSARS
ncbi:hypothetical protein AB0V79_27790 [Mesorhizobium ciceri]|uniref:hypothetical protein n=1 Tax=Mesorhizobium TaxID=68287 RepID=UPI0007A93B8C|nr:hypothetical protein [Mesorhizobium ciceri]AMX98972.1 hypothetical protein A4R29_05365 [Mesorhizobium ciceri biovar biserrulae]